MTDLPPSAADAWRAWLDLMHRRDVSPNTIRLRDLVLHDLWHDLASRGKAWHEVSWQDYQRWLERRCRPGKRNAGGPLSPGSRNTYSRAALCFYRFAAEWGLLEANPLAEVAASPRPPIRPRALAINLLTDLVAVVDPRIRMMVLLGYHQALRISEIVRLRVEDLMLHADQPMLLVHGKGGQAAWMPIAASLLPALRAFAATRPPSGPLIPNWRFPGQPLSVGYATRLLAAAMRPVVGDTSHALRHTAARQLRRLTRDPFIVRDALRHASLDMQAAYVGADLELLADALARLPNLLDHSSSAAPGA